MSAYKCLYCLALLFDNKTLWWVMQYLQYLFYSNLHCFPRFHKCFKAYLWRQLVYVIGIELAILVTNLHTYWQFIELWLLHCLYITYIHTYINYNVLFKAVACIRRKKSQLRRAQMTHASTQACLPTAQLSAFQS